LRDYRVSSNPSNIHQDKNFLNDKAFYESPEWKALSKTCKKRDGYTCRSCGKKARTKDEKRKMHADHIIARSKGGRDTLTNLQTLCELCHADKHPHLARAIASRESKSMKNDSPKMFRPTKLSRFNSAGPGQQRKTSGLRSRIY